MASGRRCAYLTMQEPDGFEVDIELAFPPLEASGWQFEPVKWRSPSEDWGRYDAVYIGAAWDYPQEPERFLGVLESIVDAGVVLVNDISLVRWTLPKTYLRDLEQKGAAIVPSLWFDSFEPMCLENAFNMFGVDRIVIKPVFGTNALDTHLLTRESAVSMAGELARVFSDRPFVIQEFASNVQSDGEFSLFFFDGEYSHAVRKVPAEADFRVQEQYGADISAYEPGSVLQSAGEQIISLVKPVPVYARVDIVNDAAGRPLLMELELIEPSMYLRRCPAAPDRFARAFDRYYNNKIGGVGK